MSTITISPCSHHPTYFSLPGGQSTNTPTMHPVSASQAFYHEQQEGSKCSLHSLNAFAGQNIIDFSQLAKVNNDYYLRQYSPIMPRQSIEKFFFITKIADVNFSKDAVRPHVLSAYIDQNKKLFHLPFQCQLQIINVALGCKRQVVPEQLSFDQAVRWQTYIEQTKALQTTLDYIKRHSSIHRIIVAGCVKDIGHYFALRKDKSLKWRIIDSWISSPNTNKDVIKELQPAFNTITEALEQHLSFNGDYKECTLIYPTSERVAEQTETPLVSDAASNPAHTLDQPNTVAQQKNSRVVSETPSFTDLSASQKTQETASCCIARLWRALIRILMKMIAFLFPSIEAGQQHPLGSIRVNVA